VSRRADGWFVGCVQGYDHWFRRPAANPNVVDRQRAGPPRPVRRPPEQLHADGGVHVQHRAHGRRLRASAQPGGHGRGNDLTFFCLIWSCNLAIVFVHVERKLQG
jgi:hypothetical protein